MERYDIIIQAGQSNADGTGKGPVEKEYEPSEDILYLEAEKTVESTPNGVIVTYADKPFSISVARDREREKGKVGDFSLTFARDYVDAGLLEEGRKLLIIRAAVGATGFKRKNWGMRDQLYLKMLEMADYALGLNTENRLAALLWHQGEHDIVFGTDPDDYKKYLKDLVLSVRERYGAEELPFIAGDFVPQWKEQNLSSCEPIVAKIKDVCGEVGSSAFVESAGLISNDQDLGNGDTIHFSHQSLYDLGHRYFDTFGSIIGKSN
ncbi:MAG: hypothetical protein IJ038_06795 [Clostridia bacterium]|nr:hypothetical protein [Clostridia bacterium]